MEGTGAVVNGHGLPVPRPGEILLFVVILFLFHSWFFMIYGRVHVSGPVVRDNFPWQVVTGPRYAWLASVSTSHTLHFLPNHIRINRHRHSNFRAFLNGLVPFIYGVLNARHIITLIVLCVRPRRVNASFLRVLLVFLFLRNLSNFRVNFYRARASFARTPIRSEGQCKGSRGLIILRIARHVLRVVNHTIGPRLAIRLRLCTTI